QRTPFSLSIVERVEAGLAEHLKKQSKRQSNHIGVAAVNRVDEHSPRTLRGVGARLVERLAGGHVPLDVVPSEWQYAHLGCCDMRLRVWRLEAFQCDAGV